jgi:inorganic pyrophosphatase/exopolyphosphatase
MTIANMIANNPAQFNWADDEFKFNLKDYPIGGKLVGTSLDITFADTDRFLTDEDFKDAIKARMATALVKFMMKNKLIEFTKIRDLNTDSFKLHARCYVTSDDQVRILRTHYGST